MVSFIEDNRGDVIIPREDMISHAEYMDMYLAVGVAIEIHNVLGRGMSEKVYQEAYLIEAMKRNFEVERERPLHLIFKDVTLTQTFIPDFYYRGLVMEFKSVEEILPVHRAQLSTICALHVLDAAYSSILVKRTCTPSAISTFQVKTDSSCSTRTTSTNTLAIIFP